MYPQILKQTSVVESYASMSRVQIAVTRTLIDIKVQIDKAKIIAAFLQVLSTKMPSARLHLTAHLVQTTYLILVS